MFASLSATARVRCFEFSTFIILRADFKLKLTLSHRRSIVLFYFIFKAAAAFHHHSDRLITEDPRDTGCARKPSVSVLKFLDRVCEDCYKLYRDVDIYTMCRLAKICKSNAGTNQLIPANFAAIDTTKGNSVVELCYVTNNQLILEQGVKMIDFTG